MCFLSIKRGKGFGFLADQSDVRKFITLIYLYLNLRPQTQCGFSQGNDYRGLIRVYEFSFKLIGQPALGSEVQVPNLRIDYATLSCTLEECRMRR